MPKRKNPGGRADEAALDALRGENDELRGVIVHLKSDLENERGNVRQLRREKATEIRAACEHEQHKCNILLGDQRTKLRQEKLNEFETLKESLVKKHETDISVLMKQRETEINRLKADLKKVQNDYEMANQQLEQSPTKKRRHEQYGNGTLAKRSPSPDLEEMRKSKKQLEDAYGALMESDRQKSKQLKKIREYHKLEMSKMKKEVNQDVRKLSTKEDTERRYMNRITDLSCKVCKLEDKCTELAEEKAECVRRNKDLEKRLRPMQEKNRKFLQRNMELTTINRCQEDKVKRLHEDNQKMKSQVEDIKKRSERLLHELNQEKMERVTISELTEKLEDAENDIKELHKTIDSLRHACSEKDRRIDLLKHRQRRARENRAQTKPLSGLREPLSGLRETSFGYEEIDGCKSLDSSWSSSVSNNTSIAEDSWDEFAREEFEKNYRRLIREHLELEKSHSLLQTQNDSYLDPERGGKHQGQLLADLLEAHSKIEDLEKALLDQGQTSKSEKRRQLPDISWIEEKQRLSVEKNDLLDKVQLLETREAKAYRELREAQEQHEIMEFRVLELEEIVEKLQRQSRDISSCHGVPTEDEDDLEITVLDLLDVDVIQLQQELLTVKYKHDGCLSKPEKTVLLQAKAMLDIADKRLKASQSTEAALKDRIRELEDEKTKLLTDAGVNPDLVIEYEDTRNKLLAADVQIGQLEDEVKDLREQDAVHNYTEDAYAKREDRFKKEIDDLRNQLRSALEGRSAETELVDERAGKFSDYQKKAEEWEGMIKELTEKIKELEKEKDAIRLQTLAASDPEVAKILEQLRDQLIEKDSHETELVEKTDQLELDLEVQKEQNEELEKINGEVTKNYYDIKEALEGAKVDINKMMKRIRGEKLGEDIDRIAELEEQVKKLESEQPLNAPSSDLDLDNQRLRVENIQLEEEVTSKDTDLKKKQEELEKLQKEFKSVDDENTVLRTKFYERSQQDKADKTDVPRLKVQIKAKEYEISQLKDQQKEADAKMAEMQTELEQLKEEPIVKVENESQLQAAPRMTPEQLSDPEKTGLEKKIIDLQEAEMTLRGRISDLETSEKVLKENIQDLLKQLKDHEEESDHIKEKADQEKSDLEVEIEELQDLTNQMKENEKAMKNKLNELEQDSDEHELKLKEEISGLTDKSQSLEMKNLDLTELISLSEVEKDKLRNQIRDAENQSKELLDEREKLRDQIEDTKEQGYEKIGKMQEELDQYHVNEQKLSESLAEAEQTEHMLREQLKRYEGPNSELQKMDALKKQLSELEMENTQLHEKVDDLQAQLRAAAEFLDETEAKYQEEIKDFEEEIADHQKHREAQDEKLDQLEQSESDLQEQLMAEQGKVQELTAKGEELVAELAKVSQEKEALEPALQETGKELSKTTDEMEILDQALKDKDEELTRSREEMDALSESLRNKDEELSEVKKEKEDLNTALKEKNAELTRTNAENIEHLNAIEEERLNDMSALQTKLDKKEAELGRSQEAVCELEELLDKQGAEGDDNLKMVMDLREDCENKQNIVLELDDKLREVENDFDKMREEKLEAEQMNLDLRDQLQQMEAEKVMLEKQLESMMEEGIEKEVLLAQEQEEQEKNLERIKELEESLDQEVKESAKYQEKLNVLEHNLSAKEAELVEKVKLLENDLAEAADMCAKHETTISELEPKLAGLKNQLLDSERFNEDLKDENEALNKRVSELKEHLDEKCEELMHLEEEFDTEQEEDKASRKDLQDRINVLRSSEEKLLERIIQLERNEKELRDELDSDDALAEKTKTKVESLESDIANLKLELKEKEQQLKDAEKDTLKAKTDIESLNKRVKILDESEAKLMEMLQESEDRENDARQEIGKLEEKIHDLEEKVESMQSNEHDLKEGVDDLEQMVSDLECSEKELKDKLNSLKQTNELLEAKCSDLEKTEQDLLQQLAIAQLDSVTQEESVRAEAAPVFEEAITVDFVDGVQSAPKSLPKGRLSRAEKDNLRRSLSKKSADELVNRCVELMDMQQELQSRLHDLEDSSMDRSRTESVDRELDDFSHREQRYKDTIARLQEEIEKFATGAKSESSAKGADRKPEDYKDRLDSLHSRLDSFITKSEQAHRHPPSYMPKTTDISDLPEDELISKIQQLEIGEISNKRKIGELEDCIKIYRQVVETVAFAMATDLEGVNLDLEKKELMHILGRKETGYEGKLQELINSESAYKKQVVDMERREALYKADLHAVQTEQRDARKEYNHHIQKLEDTISDLERNEAKLKSKLNLGSKDRTTETVSKIHDLKDRIIDLEASEKQLRRTVHDLQTERDDLRQNVSEHRSRSPSTHGPVDRLRDLEHQQEVDELQAKIRQQENSETALQDQVLKLRSQDNTGYAERIEHLERSERALQRKLEMYEQHELDDVTDSLMDKPEDLLRQRIHELEKMEKHLRSQITDLENDREELHEIARKDKNSIHELNVKRRELQLAEKNLKEQVSMFEVTENNLLAKIDAMQDELDDLEDQLSRVKRAEKNWKGQAKELKFTEESAAKKVINLEVLVEELQSSETKLKKTLYTVEQENLALKDKVETVQEQLYDLQSTEIAHKQRIRDLENKERTLQCDLAKFECSENVAARRSGDLESLTDSLSERIYALEEERANLKYEVSDLAVVFEDTKKQAALLENSEIALKQQIDYLETNEKRFKKRNQELELQRIELLRKADDAGHSELKQKDLVQALERSEKKLKFKLQELENNAASLERGNSKIKDLEKENTSLQDELYECNRKIQRMEKVIKTLEDKQRQADLTRSRGGTAVITRQELAEMRAQIGILEETEKSLMKAEKTEVNLKETIAELRRGKNACGHEQEIEELRKQLAHYQNLLREKAAIEEKYNHVRSELRILQDSIKYDMILDVDGDVIVAVKKRGADDRPGQTPSRDQYVQVSNVPAPDQLRPFTAPERRELEALNDDPSQHEYPQPTYAMPRDAEPLAEDRFDQIDRPDGNADDFQKPKEDPDSLRLSKDEALAALAKALDPYDTFSDDEVKPQTSQTVHSAPEILHEDLIVPTEQKKDESPMNFSDFFQEPPQEEPLVQDSTAMSKRRTEKRRSRPQDDGDESDSSSLDEHPVAGMNMRRTSNMFDFKENVPRRESDHWEKVEQAAPHEQTPELEEPYWKTVERPTEDVAVTLNISDPTSDEEKPRRLAPLQTQERFGDQSDFTDTSPDRRLPRQHRKGSYDTDSGISTMPDPHHPHRFKSSPTQERVLSARISPVHSAPTRDSHHGRLPSPSDTHLSPWLTQHLVDQKSISTSTAPLMHSSIPASWPDGPQRSIATDTTDISRQQNDEIAQLRNKIDDLETELRVKTRELETSQFVARELEEKVKTSEDPYAWKSKLKEKDRDIQVQERMNRNLFDENSKLERELIAKQRQVIELEAEIDNLDQVLKAKDAADNSEIVQELKHEIDRIQNQLEARQHECIDLETQRRTLNNQNERKEKDIAAKSEKIDEINREMRRCQNALKDAEAAKLKSVGDLRNAEIDLTRLKDADKKLQTLKEEHHELQMNHAELLNELRKLERAKKERDELENVVDELKKRIRDYDQIKGERADLEMKVKLLEEQLEQKCNEADTLASDRHQMRQQIRKMEREIDELNNKLRDYGLVKARYDEMEKIKDRAERAVAPLRAKVMRLAQKCKEKDDLIRRLADDLKHSGHGNPDLLHEVDHLRADAAHEEYNRPETPIGGMTAFDDDAFSPSSSKKSPYSPRSSDNPNVDQVLHNDLFDNEHHADIIPTRLEKVEHAAPSSFADSLYDSPSRIPRPLDSSSGQLNNQRGPVPRDPSRRLPKPDQPEKNCFVAIADYDPTNFSRSGHPRLELPLKEGDVVQVFGSPDEKGYYEAEVKGRTGLVPNNYLQPMPNPESQGLKKRKTKKMPPVHMDASPEHILDMHDHLEHAHIPTHDVPAMRPQQGHHDRPSNGLTQPGGSVPNPVYIPIPSHGCTEILPTTIIRDVSQPNTLERGQPAPHDVHDGRGSPALPRQLGPPEPPSDFHIERILSDHNVMMEWQPPPIDEFDRSNGVQISGYKIFVDGVECHRLSSPHLTKALIGRLNLHVPHKISIQSYTTLGQASRAVDTYFQDVLPDLRDGMSDLGSNLGDNFDGGSITSSNFYESGERKKCMAVYDYNPADQSPNSDPINELSFKTGDVIFTYGPVREDGFYHAKIRGRRGLVPESFIEEMPQSKKKKPHGRKVGSASSKGSHDYSPRDRKPSKHQEAEPARLY
ncbi:centrosomal protein of 290 kDa-like isoform X3 [Lineus longissimus]|uniref:centrosomal protein of 290 kDa-like isoform X3 n=1 Tax=Lineus longissimus TaxID=88925 RepID=UPI00315D4F02